MLFIIGIISSPILVKVYFVLIGNFEESVVLVNILWCSNSFNLWDRILGVISESLFFISEYLFCLSFPLYNSKIIRNVHFFPRKFIEL